MIRRLCILDTETSGLEPATAALLEVGVAIYSVEHRTMLTSASWLAHAESNAAENVNGIPPAALREVSLDADAVRDRVRKSWAENADVVVAHCAEFDRKWMGDLGRPWVCSQQDIEWPGRTIAGAIEPTRERPGQSLVALCLAHGLGVSHAHRALTDVMLLVRLFERVAELGHDVQAMLARAMRPKATFAVADTGFDPARNELAKKAGFRWEPQPVGLWTRTMAKEDVAGLPFEVKEVTA